MQFVDLRAQHDEVRAEIEAAFRRIVDASSFVGGADVEGFERDFADFVGVPHAVGVASGTDAVRMALQVVGVRPGDAIVTVAHTFIGTVEGAVQLGCHPLFIDVDADSRNMSPGALRRFLEDECERGADGPRHRRSGRRIGAILPVHLYGQSADMAPILDLGSEHGVPVVEDAAQAQGARYRFPDGRDVACGAMGDAAAFSFYPGKNLGAMGEAGAVTVRDEARAQRLRLIRDHGQAEKYVHQIADGGNYRLDAIQAAVLRIKLSRLEAWNDARREAAAQYGRLLADSPIEPPREMEHAHHVWHLYVVSLPERDRVRAAMGEGDVPTGLHYPIPLHLQPAFRGQDVLGGPLPVTERLAAACLSLPMHAHLEPADVERAVETLLDVARVPQPT